MGNNLLNFLGNYSGEPMIRFVMPGDLSGQGTVDPAPPPNTNVTMDQGWEEQLKPDEELKEAKHEDYACEACLTYEKTIVLLPCRHPYYCDVCFRKMMTDPHLQKKCPVCNEKFENIVRIY
jgi:hypothetical protein